MTFIRLPIRTFLYTMCACNVFLSCLLCDLLLIVYRPFNGHITNIWPIVSRRDLEYLRCRFKV